MALVLALELLGDTLSVDGGVVVEVVVEVELLVVVVVVVVVLVCSLEDVG